MLLITPEIRNLREIKTFRINVELTAPIIDVVTTSGKIKRRHTGFTHRIRQRTADANLMKIPTIKSPDVHIINAISFITGSISQGDIALKYRYTFRIK